MNTVWIRVVFGVVLALVLLFTVAFGVAMALPGPKPPEDPGVTFRQLTAGGDSDSSQNRLTASIDRYYADARNYRDAYVVYQRNVFLVGAVLAALLAAAGLLLPAMVNYLRWGLLLSAALVFIWAGYVATRAVPNPAPPVTSVLALLAAGAPQQLDFAGRFLRFAVSFVSLIILLFVGLWRLTEWPAPARRQPAAAPVASPTAASAWAPPTAPVAPSADSTAAEAPSAPSTPSIEAPPADARPASEPARVDNPATAEAVQWQRPPTGSDR